LRAVDAIETAIQARSADRDDIPLPSRKGKTFATLPAQTAVKVLLWRAMRAQKTRKAELAKRLKWHAPQVDRLLDLSHASRLDQIEAALKAVGAELEVSLKEVA
jgi:antitoxin HicB